MLSLIGAATFLEAFAGVIAPADILAHVGGPHGQAQYDRLLADPDTRCWLAELPETGSPVGYQILTGPDLPVDLTPQDIELKRIYAFATQHGSGLARCMLETAIDAARDMGRTRMLLGVYAQNLRAIAFYRKMGFETIGERVFTVGAQDFQDLVMARGI